MKRKLEKNRSNMRFLRKESMHVLWNETYNCYIKISGKSDRSKVNNVLYCVFLRQFKESKFIFSLAQQLIENILKTSLVLKKGLATLKKLICMIAF